MRQGRPTIDDVASLSGVARVTVSRVLNDGPNVSESVRKRVLAAVSQLGYSVNVQARMLAKGGSRTILVAFSHDQEREPNSYYQSAVEVGALRGSASLGVEVVTLSVAEQGEAGDTKVRQMVQRTQPVGVILTPPFSDRQPLIDLLSADGSVVALISPGCERERGHPEIAGVGMDDEAAGHAMATHMLDLGHRRIGYIAGHADHLSAEKRLAGTRRALFEHGLAQDDLIVLRGDFTFKAGVDLTPRMLDLIPSPTAIICANDDMAVGALFAAHRDQLRVPQDLSIGGFDDTPISGLVWPPLTTIHQPIQEMSERAARMVLGAHEASGSETQHNILPFSLVVRGSTARPLD